MGVLAHKLSIKLFARSQATVIEMATTHYRYIGILLPLNSSLSLFYGPLDSSLFPFIDHTDLEIYT